VFEISRWIKDNQLITFFLFTFIISWGVPGVILLISYSTGTFIFSMAQYTPLSYLAIWSPAISCFMVIGITRGKQGLKAYLSRFKNWKKSWPWILFVIIGVPLMNFLSAVLTDMLGMGKLFSINLSFSSFIILALLTATEGPFEEFGWRGFALPKLQEKYSGFTSSIILGLIWATWHVPAFFVESVMTGSIEGSIEFIIIRLYINIIITSLIMTIVYNATDGSVPLMFIYHWFMNIAYPWESRAGIHIAQDILGFFLLIVLLFFFYHMYLQKENLFVQLTPEL
jgi:membrane protease YdiL (CAAX protease family)